MIERSWEANRTERELTRFVHKRLDLDELRHGVDELMRRHVPSAATCWHTLDPATVLFTTSYSQGFDTDRFPAFVENEFLVPDAIKLRQLARQRPPVGTLWRATEGRLERSSRHAAVYRPQGYGDELRAVFVIGGAPWAAVIAARDLSAEPYSERDVEFIARIAPLLAEAFRRILIAEEADANAQAEGPGLVILDAKRRMEAATPAGYRWLDELGFSPEVSEPLPTALIAVDASVRAAALGRVSVGPARARVRTRTGQWLVLHASLLDARHDGRVAVILEPARPAEVAGILLEGYGMTPRERDVVALVLQGRSTQEMATELGLSAYTVQDHLKGVFAKLGVGSRSELVGIVFRRDYLPRMDRTPLSSSGSFATIE